MQKYSRPLAGRPVTVVFWWGKTHTKVKTARLPFLVFVRCRFPGFFSAMSNTATWPRAVRWHESLPDHFRPCPQNTRVPYTAARDWLKPKGVSALTERSGVVYSNRHTWILLVKHTGTLLSNIQEFCQTYKNSVNQTYMNKHTGILLAKYT